MAERLYRAFIRGIKHSDDPSREVETIRRVADKLTASKYIFLMPITFINEPVLLTTTHTNLFGKKKVPHIVEIFLSPDKIDTMYSMVEIDAYKEPTKITSFIDAKVNGKKYHWDVSLYDAMYWIKDAHDRMGFSDNPRVGKFAKFVYNFLKNNYKEVDSILNDVNKNAARIKDEIHIAPHAHLETKGKFNALIYANIGKLCKQVIDNSVSVTKQRTVFYKNGEKKAFIKEVIFDNKEKDVEADSIERI